MAVAVVEQDSTLFGPRRMFRDIRRELTNGNKTTIACRKLKNRNFRYKLLEHAPEVGTSKSVRIQRCSARFRTCSRILNNVNFEALTVLVV